MRQAGMKPKGHSSGTYCVRANAKGGKGGNKTEKSDPFDFDNDGKVTWWDYAGWILLVTAVVTWFTWMIILDNNV